MRSLLGGAAGLLALLTAVSCSRSDIRTTRIRVPAMADARAVRVVTNAVLNELDGRTDMFQHGCDVDLSRKLVFYHESEALRSPAYQRNILARIRELGYEARIAAVGPSELPPCPTNRGPLRVWPNRHTLVLSIPGMKCARDANVVVDAIAYARLGGEDPRIVVNPASRSLSITYNARGLAAKNLELAVACVGYEANDVPADVGQDGSIPHGWFKAAS